MIKNKICIYKETPTVKPIQQFVAYPGATTSYLKTFNITDEFLEQELERAVNLGIEENIKYKHKHIPNKTLEIIGFNLDKSKIFKYKNEANFIICELTTSSFNCRSTFTISELLNEYIQI